MEEGLLGSALGKLPPIPLRLSPVPPPLHPLLRDRTSPRRSYSLVGSPQPRDYKKPAASPGIHSRDPTASRPFLASTEGKGLTFA